MMDNLVDIDALLGGLELESDSEQCSNEKRHGGEAFPKLSGNVEQSPSEPIKHSNGLTNGAGTTFDSHSSKEPMRHVEDLLDLDTEPDFGPAPSSLQMSHDSLNFTAKTAMSGDREWHKVNSAAMAPHTSLTAYGYTATQTGPVTHSMGYNTTEPRSILSHHSNVPSTISDKSPLSVTGDGLASFSAINQQSGDLFSNLIPTSNTELIVSQPLVNMDTMLVSSEQATQPQVYAPMDIVHRPSLVDSEVSETTSLASLSDQVTTQGCPDYSSVSHQSDFQPLTEDLDFITSYEHQRSGTLVVVSNTALPPSATPTTHMTEQDQTSIPISMPGQLSAELRLPSNSKVESVEHPVQQFTLVEATAPSIGQLSSQPSLPSNGMQHLGYFQPPNPQDLGSYEGEGCGSPRTSLVNPLLLANNTDQCFDLGHLTNGSQLLAEPVLDIERRPPEDPNPIVADNSFDALLTRPSQNIINDGLNTAVIAESEILKNEQELNLELPALFPRQNLEFINESMPTESLHGPSPSKPDCVAMSDNNTPDEVGAYPALLSSGAETCPPYQLDGAAAAYSDLVNSSNPQSSNSSSLTAHGQNVPDIYANQTTQNTNQLVGDTWQKNDTWQQNDTWPQNDTRQQNDTWQQVPDIVPGGPPQHHFDTYLLGMNSSMENKSNSFSNELLIGQQATDQLMGGQQVTNQLMTGQLMTGQQVSGQLMGGQQVTNQLMTGQQVSDNQVSGLQQMLGQQVDDQQVTGQLMSGNQITDQQIIGQPMFGQQMTSQQLNGQAFLPDNNADEEFNSLLAANGYPTSTSSNTVVATQDFFHDNLFGTSSANGSVGSLQKNSHITGSIDSFTKLQQAESQPPVDSFTALHNMSINQTHRNSLLEDNGIIRATDEDIGWDIGAAPTTAISADDVFADIGLDEPITVDMNIGVTDNFVPIDELAPGEIPPPAAAVTGFVEESFPSYPDPVALHSGVGLLPEELVLGPTPTTADLQAMVAQDEPTELDTPDDPLPAQTVALPPISERPSPPPYQVTDPALDPPPPVLQDPPPSEAAAYGAEEVPPAESEQEEYLDLGATKPYWMPDQDTDVCLACEVKFTFRKRRHHCRSCGKIFCDNCCNMKSRLQYMDFKEARVCKACHQSVVLAAVQQERLLSQSHAVPGQEGIPAHPAEEPGAVGGPGAAADGRPVPTGVLKDTSARQVSTRDSNRSVMFSDGIRPGDENSSLDGADTTPSSRLRRKNRARQKTSQRLRETLRNTFLIPETTLPPLLCYDNDSAQYSAVDSEPDELGLIAKLREEGDDGRFAFAIHKDLNVEIKIVDMNCCTNKQCWCFASHGLNTVSQDEVVFVIECLPGENTIPRDVFHMYKMLYQQAASGLQVTELGYADLSEVQPFEGDAGFLGSTDHIGLLFIRSTFQCLKGLCLPDPPYLFAILIHRMEIPWARLFPVRLKLRLGAEFKYYPCPLMSVRGREPVYREINNTIMNLLADFHTYKYSLSKIEGFTVHLMDKITTISIPKNMYSTVMKVVGASQECVIAFGASFSTQADSHIVCMQNADGLYTSRTMNIRDQQRTVTGASFVVFSGSMKESYGVSAKCSIVEDGIMVQVTKEALDEFKAKLNNMQEYTVTCSRTDETKEQNEQVKIVWVDDYKDYNIGVVSPIDEFPMDGVMSLRVKSFNDLTRDSYTIRWTEVFFVQADESRLTMDTMEITQFSETIANSTCSALAPFLGQLYEQGMKKVALRVTLGPEQVEYICGSLGHRLQPDLMNNLDGELVPVLHSAASVITGSLLVLELIFHVLE